MIDLTTEEVLGLIKNIGEDKKHEDKSLFLLLQYYYGRRSREIALIKWEDINFKTNEITLNICKKKIETRLTLSLPDIIAKDIKKILTPGEPGDYIFKNENKRDSYLRNIRDYLERNTRQLIINLYGKDLGANINTHDFRRLRGQNLYLEGATLEFIQKMYYHKSLDQTLDYLQIQSLQVNKMLNDNLKKHEDLFKL